MAVPVQLQTRKRADCQNAERYNAQKPNDGIGNCEGSYKVYHLLHPASWPKTTSVPARPTASGVSGCASSAARCSAINPANTGPQKAPSGTGAVQALRPAAIVIIVNRIFDPILCFVDFYFVLQAVIAAPCPVSCDDAKNDDREKNTLHRSRALADAGVRAVVNHVRITHVTTLDTAKMTATICA